MVYTSYTLALLFLTYPLSYCLRLSTKYANTCQSRDKLIYHTETLAAYGFGSQYSSIIRAYALGLLTDRTTVVKGRWTLGCPNADAGVSCYLKLPCKADNVDFNHQSPAEMKWNDDSKKKDELGVPNLYHAMLKNEGEWHADGDLLMWMPHADMFYNCDTRQWATNEVNAHFVQQLSGNHATGGGIEMFKINKENNQAEKDLSVYLSARKSLISLQRGDGIPDVDQTCKGLSKWTFEDIYRHVAQKVVPFNHEVEAATQSAKNLCKQQSQMRKTLGIHVRRTDKVAHEDKLYHVKQYIDAAKNKNWDFDFVIIITDDPAAVRKEADELKLNYFIAEGERKRPNDGEDALIQFQGEAQFLGEVGCMADTDYFVGSEASNVARMVQVLRTQPHETAIDLNSGRDIRFVL